MGVENLRNFTHQGVSMLEGPVLSVGEAPIHPKAFQENDVDSAGLEQLITLKAALRKASRDEFWKILCRAFGRLSQSQYCFITQKSLARPIQSEAVESDRSCTSIIAYYHDDGHGNSSEGGNASLQPCDPMPSSDPQALHITGLSSKSIIVPCDPPKKRIFVERESYISIPLYIKETHTADFWVVWSLQGTSKRIHSSTFLEMAFRILEDIVAQNLLEISQASRYKISMLPLTPPEIESVEQPVQSPKAASHSLEKYAKKISHELRTPLQGIMGLTELMHCAVHDASSVSSNATTRRTLQILKDDLEAVQSSSRRAADAADNVIQAYELNVLIPEVRSPPTGSEQDSPQSPRGLKRRRSESDCTQQFSRALKSSSPSRKLKSAETKQVLASPPHLDSSLHKSDDPKPRGRHLRDTSVYTPSFLQSAAHGLQLTDVRRCTREIVNDCIKREGRLGLVIPYDSARGQRIEIHALASNGDTRVKTITWDVDADVPEYILVEQRDMAKMISCVFQNALKFTEQGGINLQIQQSAGNKSITINIKDSGPGIAPEFRSEIFKPFSQEDDSTTRTKEGLGLGLVVAKGLAQRLKGGLSLVSADMEGPNRGSQFVMQVPMSPNAEPSPPVQSIEDSMEYFTAGMPLDQRRNQSGSMHKGLGIESQDNEAPPYPSLEAETWIRPSAPVKRRYSRAKITSPPTTIQEEGAPESSTSKRPSLARNHQYQTDNHNAPPPTSPTDDLPSDAPQLPQPTALENFASTHPLNFLVAEDNVVNRKMLVKMLVKLGYDARTQIREAADGLEAVRQVKAAAPAPPLPGRRCSSAPPICTSPEDESRAAADGDGAPAEPIDVILMDLWMPNMDGYEAAERILEICRPRAGGDAAPLILAVTADATQASLERAARAGMGGLMLKPFGIAELERLVREGWGRRQQRAAGALAGAAAAEARVAFAAPEWGASGATAAAA